MDKNADKTDRKKKFLQICTGEAFPYLKAQEVYRKKILKSFSIISGLALLIPLFLYIFLEYFLKVHNELVFSWFVTLEATALIGVCFVFCEKKSIFEFNIKKYCMQNILEVFGKLNWSNFSEIESCVCEQADKSKTSAKYKIWEKMTHSPLFPYFDEVKVDDVFSGKCGTKEYEAYEVCANYKFQEGSRAERIVKAFKGVVLIFQLEKCTEYPIIVTSKKYLTQRSTLSFMIKPIFTFFPGMIIAFFIGFDKSLLMDSKAPIIGLLGFLLFLLFIIAMCTYGKYKKRPKLDIKQIELEDVKFAKKYDVFCNDEVESRYILTPVFMEKFANLKKVFNAKKIGCCFQGKEVIFAFSTNKKLFEVGSFVKSLLNPKYFEVLFEEINAIYDIIDHFDLTD